MKVNGLKVNSLYVWAEVCKFGQMGLDMRAIGRKINNMDKESKPGLKVPNMKENME